MKLLTPWQTALALSIIVGSLCLIPWAQKEMNQIRKAKELTHMQPLENAPPLVAFTTIALGGFRGLIADFLFLRLQSMQERENFFEIVQLASWIVQLEPRFSAATIFLAWNMTYNISVMFNAPDDRWRWVQSGIELLRDQGLIYNLGTPSLYKELGWIYQHKIGENLDNSHLYYKAQLAKQVIRILGDAPSYDWSDLATAPQNETELKRSLGDKTPAFHQFLENIQTTLEELEFEFRSKGNLNSKTQKKLVDLGLARIVERYFRVRWLKSELKLDAKVIREIVDRYGPLDFRLPDAHAIYWATTGLKHSPDGRNIDCERMIFQSLKNAFIAGKLIHLSETHIMHTTPNLGLADSVKKAYLDSIKQYKGNQTIIAGYINYMVEAIVIFYIYGQKKKALAYLRSLNEMSEFKKDKGRHKNLEQLVLTELAGDIKSLSREKALVVIQALLLQSYNSLAFGDYNRATGFELLAKKIYSLYANTIAENQEMFRRGIPEYELIQRQCQTQFIRNYPPIIAERLNLALQLEEKTNSSKKINQ